MLNTLMVSGKRKTCRIYDAGESFADRYTIAFRAYKINGRLVYPYLASGNNPFHPLGFGQHGESEYFVTGKHLGKRIEFNSLPKDVKTFILQNI